MKKILLTVLIVQSFQSFVVAQDRFRIGVFGELNYSTHKATNSILDNTDGSFASLGGGLSIEYAINERFAITTGLAFEKRRIDYFAKTSYSYINGSGNYIQEEVDVVTENKYNYITIPLLLKYSFGPKKSFFAHLGPYLSFTTDRDKKTKFTYLNSGFTHTMPESDYNFPLNRDLSGKEYGISLGLGKSFVIKNKNKIFVELRNNFGLTNRLDGTMSRGISGELRCNTINLITGFSFGL